MLGKFRIKLCRLFRRQTNDTNGQDLIEYALMAAFIAVAIGATFPTTIGPNISSIFSKVQSNLTQASSTS